MTRHNSPQESPDNFARHVRVDQCDGVVQIGLLKYTIMIKNLYPKSTEILVLSGKK